MTASSAYYDPVWRLDPHSLTLLALWEERGRGSVSGRVSKKLLVHPFEQISATLYPLFHLFLQVSPWDVRCTQTTYVKYNADEHGTARSSSQG